MQKTHKLKLNKRKTRRIKSNGRKTKRRVHRTFYNRGGLRNIRDARKLRREEAENKINLANEIYGQYPLEQIQQANKNLNDLLPPINKQKLVPIIIKDSTVTIEQKQEIPTKITKENFIGKSNKLDLLPISLLEKIKLDEDEMINRNKLKINDKLSRQEEIEIKEIEELLQKIDTNLIIDKQRIDRENEFKEKVIKAQDKLQKYKKELRENIKKSDIDEGNYKINLGYEKANINPALNKKIQTLKEKVNKLNQELSSLKTNPRQKRGYGLSNFDKQLEIERENAILKEKEAQLEQERIRLRKEEEELENSIEDY